MASQHASKNLGGTLVLAFDVGGCHDCRNMHGLRF
jgi:hypothetical protein